METSNHDRTLKIMETGKRNVASKDVRFLPRVGSEDVVQFLRDCLYEFDSVSESVLKSSVDMHLTNLVQVPHIDYSCQNYEATSKIQNAKTLKQIEEFLLRVGADEAQEVPLYVLSDQILALFTQKGAPLGVKLCFSIYVRSLSLVSLFLIPEFNKVYRGFKSDKSLANKAIDMLLKTKLPPLFYPNVDSNVILSVDLCGIKPVSPTAIATTETMLYVGCEGPLIKGIPLHRTQQHDIVEIPVEGFPDEPYSLVCQNGFLILSAGEGSALHVDLSARCTFTLPISYFKNPFSVLNKFGPPVVSDGELLYSISFNEAKIKTFKLELDAVLYVTSVKLVVKDTKLIAPFTEVLPPAQKNICSIATNGVYISFVFRERNISICRTFFLRNGVHQSDVVLEGGPIHAWCFDGARPAHCVISGNKAQFYSGCFTLPKWMIHFDEPKEQPKVTNNSQSEIIEMVSRALAIFAAQIIGSEAKIPFGFSDECHSGTMEEHACNFIDIDNHFAAQAFLVFMGIRMKGTQNIGGDNLILLAKLYNSYGDERYMYLQEQIAWLFLSSLDVFCQTDSETSSMLLEKIMSVSSHKILLYRYLPKAQYLIRVLTTNSLTVLCQISLATTFTHDEEALSLLRELQFSFIARGESGNWKLFHVYVQALFMQFCEDYQHFYTDEWTVQRFVRTVSFFILNDLVSLIRATCAKTKFGCELADILFRIGIMQKPPRTEETAVVWNTFCQCLFVALTLFISLIKNDTNFYSFGKEIPKEAWSVKDPLSLDVLDHFGISDEVVLRITNVIMGSCLVNVTQQRVLELTTNLFQMIQSGRKTEEDVIQRCEQISKIQPQLIENVFMYLCSNDELNVVSDISQCHPIRLVHEIGQAFHLPELVSMLGFFAHDLDACREHFCVIPQQYLLEDSMPVVLRLYLPLSMCPTTVSIDANILLDLSTEQILLVLNRLLDLANVLVNPEVLDTIDSAGLICPDGCFDQALKTCLLMRVAVRTRTKFDIGKCESLMMRCIVSSDYFLAYHACNLAEELVRCGYQPNRFLEFAVKIIGGYLSGQENMFGESHIHGKAFKIVLLLTDMFRCLIEFNTNSISAVFRALFDKPTKLNSIVVFAICNTMIDIPRPFKRVTFLSASGRVYQGNIASMDDDSFVLESGEHFMKNEVSNLKIMQSKGFLSREFICEFGPYIKRTITEFEGVNAFQYTCLYQLLSIPEFRSQWTFDDIFHICRPGDFHGSLTELMNWLGNCWTLAHCQLPTFDITPQVPVTEMVPMTRLEYDLFGSVKRERTKGILDSYAGNTVYLSHLVHPKSESWTQLEELSEIGYELVISCVSSHYLFESDRFTVHGKSSVVINPRNTCVNVMCNGETHTFVIPTTADGLFIALTLNNGSLLKYSCEADGNLIEPETTAPGKPMQRVDDELQLFPREPSAEWRSVGLQLLHKNFTQLFSAMILSQYIRGSCGDGVQVMIQGEIEMTGLLLLQIMKVIDSGGCSYNLSFSQISPTKIQRKAMETACTFLKYFRANSDVSGRFKKWLVEWIQKETLATIEASALIGSDPVEQGFTSTSFSRAPVGELPTIPVTNLANNALDCTRQLRHAISMLLFLSTSHKEFVSYMDVLRPLLRKVIPAQYLKGLVDTLCPATMLSFDEHSIGNWCKEQMPELVDKECPDLPDSTVFFFTELESFPVVSYLSHMLSSTSAIAKGSLSIEDLGPGTFIYLTSDSPVKVSGTDDFILPANTDHVLEFSGKPLMIESQTECNIRWRAFKFDKQTFYEQIKSEVLQWSVVHSHQIVLSGCLQSENGPEFYNYLPVSTVARHDVVCFFIDLLRRLSSTEDLFLRRHTLAYHFSDHLPSSDDRLETFYSMFPQFREQYVTQIAKTEDLTDAEKVAIYALTFGTTTDLPITVELRLCKKIGRSAMNSGYRTTFSRITGIDPDVEIEPQYLRTQIAMKQLTGDEILSLTIWKECSSGQQDHLTPILKNLCSYLLYVFLEWTTQIWGLCALRHSKCPNVVVRGSTDPGRLEAHSELHTLVIGLFDDTDSLRRKLMECLERFIENCYQ